MSDLISRKDAIDALGEEPIVMEEWTDEYNKGMRTLWAVAKRDIESLPSIDAVSVKRGRWAQPVGCNGCRYDLLGDPRCTKCARSFQDHYKAERKES